MIKFKKYYLVKSNKEIVQENNNRCYILCQEEVKKADTTNAYQGEFDCF
jgi:hypothetical protein